MSNPSEAEIREFLVQQIALWNAEKRQEMTDMYKRYSPKGLAIEYVGQPAGDGWAAYEHMWDEYGGRVKGEIVEILVNGNEAACHFLNVRKDSGIRNPSIETYRFDDGKLTVRYYHRSVVH